jgi:serine/threonine protein kinase
MERFLPLAIGLADAVSAAHRQGILHRDLKPENVMLTAEGRLKVLDFGLAKLAAAPDGVDRTTCETRSVTRDGWIVGTLAYMSPEQAQGLPVDERSDIFSLGVLLYELVAGRTPFGPRIAPRADVAEYLRRIREDAPTPPTADLPDPPAPRQAAMLDRIVLRALEKERSRRQRSAAELAADVRCLIDELPEGLG